MNKKISFRNMKYFKPLLLLLFGFLKFQLAMAQAPLAGMPTKFSETESEFIQQLGDMMRKTKLVEVEKSAIQRSTTTPSWEK